MTEINGLDTIIAYDITLPEEIELDKDLVLSETLLMPAWSSKYIAIIPYCFKCREPLVWHRPPRDDDTIFHCPKCKTRWIMKGAKAK